MPRLTSLSVWTQRALQQLFLAPEPAIDDFVAADASVRLNGADADFGAIIEELRERITFQRLEFRSVIETVHDVERAAQVSAVWLTGISSLITISGWSSGPLTQR